MEKLQEWFVGLRGTDQLRNLILRNSIRSKFILDVLLHGHDLCHEKTNVLQCEKLLVPFFDFRPKLLQAIHYKIRIRNHGAELIYGRACPFIQIHLLHSLDQEVCHDKIAFDTCQ